jgi:NADPH:quinone reductase
VLRLIELPRPEAGVGQLVVRVAAATVNPTDLLMREGQQAAMMQSLAPPYVAGMEFAGRVHEIGAGAAGFAAGQPVMGVVNPRRPERGANAEYVVAPVASVVALPAGIAEADLIAASTLPMNGLTALMALEALALNPGQSLLVTGGAGALGGYVIQLARQAGLTVVADAKDVDAALLRGFGADLIVPRGEAMAAAVRQRFPSGIDGLVDCALLGDAAAALLRSGGVAVTVRRANPITDARVTVRPISVSDRVEDHAALERVAQAWRDGVLTPRVALRLPVAAASQAHRRVEEGGLRGRVVLTF